MDKTHPFDLTNTISNVNKKTLVITKLHTSYTIIYFSYHFNKNSDQNTHRQHFNDK